MSARLLPESTAIAAWVLALASAAGATTGLLRHALPVAIGFRVLTAWRLSVAAGVVWRGEQDRVSTVRIAALGSMAAHGALVCGALGAAVLGGLLPGLAQVCAAAQRCSPVPWSALPLGVAGIAHGVWMWRVTCVIPAGDVDIVSSA